MTETIISLLSILAGIIAANLTGYFFRKSNFGFTGNSIAGVFGSVFFIKSLGRLGFDPVSIMISGNMNVPLFILNLLISAAGGALALVIAEKLKRTMGKNKE